MRDQLQSEEVLSLIACLVPGRETQTVSSEDEQVGLKMISPMEEVTKAQAVVEVEKVGE